MLKINGFKLIGVPARALIDSDSYRHYLHLPITVLMPARAFIDSDKPIKRWAIGW